MSAVMILIGIAMLSPRSRAVAGRWPSACCSACCSSPRRRAALPRHGGAADAPPRARAPALFAIVYTSVASAIYFSLGVVADHALGLTPFVFLIAGIFFVLAAMTYVEGASLHQDRGGSTVFARYAFNELWSSSRAGRSCSTT